MNYEKTDTWWSGKKRTQTNPNEPKTNPISQEPKMSATSLFTKDYESKSNPTLGENKPNLPEAKTRLSISLTRSYANNPAMTLCQNKANSNPIQTQFRNRSGTGGVVFGGNSG
jgi:hypothetical protein